MEKRNRKRRRKNPEKTFGENYGENYVKNYGESYGESYGENTTTNDAENAGIQNYFLCLHFLLYFVVVLKENLYFCAVKTVTKKALFCYKKQQK